MEQQIMVRSCNQAVSQFWVVDRGSFTCSASAPNDWRKLES